MFEHAPILAGGVAMIAILWAYVTNVPAVFIAIAGLFTFGTILWIVNSIGLWLERHKKLISLNVSHIKEPHSQQIPSILEPQLQNPQDDAIYHLVISGRDFSSRLSILTGVEGWPVHYPLGLRNTRPIVIELVGYTVRILWNRITVQVVSWKNPDNLTSTGMSVGHPKYLKSDEPNTLNIPVALALMKVALPGPSPPWGIDGELYFQGDKEVIRKPFDFKDDNYTLQDAEWDALKKNALPNSY